MSEEELEDLLGIGCCEYHIEIGKEAKKEIEKLKENNQAMQEEMARTWKKLDEKENIIKEVREYVIQEMNNINAITYINILDILDKEKKMDKELKNRLGRLEHKIDFVFNKLCEVEDFFKDDYYKKLYEEAKAKKENAEWELVDFIERGRNRGTIREEEQKAYRNYQEYEEILDKENK